MKNSKKQFNAVVVGTGGQGLITILQVMAKAAMNLKLDVKTSELHGLSQRGGSVEVHARIGKKIYSPLVAKGKADLILSLEQQEALNAAGFAGKNTFFLINKLISPIPFKPPVQEKEIARMLSQKTKKISFIPASDICRKELGTDVTAGIFLLTLAALKEIIPIDFKTISKAVLDVIPEKYLKINRETLGLAQKYAAEHKKN
jgi:indolepyruvate ferredoxin oxidoreductase beta subunit